MLIYILISTHTLTNETYIIQIEYTEISTQDSGEGFAQNRAQAMAKTIDKTAGISEIMNLSATKNSG